MSFEEILELAAKLVGVAAAGVGAWFGGGYMQRRKYDAEATRIGAETTGSLTKLGPEVAEHVQQIYASMVAELNEQNQRITRQLTEQISLLRTELSETRAALQETRKALEQKGREHEETVAKLKHAEASAKELANTLRKFQATLKRHGIEPD